MILGDFFGGLWGNFGVIFEVVFGVILEGNWGIFLGSGAGLKGFLGIWGIFHHFSPQNPNPRAFHGPPKLLRNPKFPPKNPNFPPHSPQTPSKKIPVFHSKHNPGTPSALPEPPKPRFFPSKHPQIPSPITQTPPLKNTTPEPLRRPENPLRNPKNRSFSLRGCPPPSKLQLPAAPAGHRGKKKTPKGGMGKIPTVPGPLPPFPLTPFFIFRRPKPFSEAFKPGLTRELRKRRRQRGPPPSPPPA